MCGIAGYIAKNGLQHNADMLHQMSQVLRHRGPDDEGFLISNKENNLALAGIDTPKDVLNFSIEYAPTQQLKSSQPFELALIHRRLSILDLSPNGHQPMCDESRKLWISYNGEIYNYKILKAQLQAAGFKFKTQTDTEVLLYAYIHWGNQFVNKLNGMWSFVIYDSEKKTLFASRDRFGVKPFYYVNTSDFFAFASEPKTFFKIPGFKPELNQKALYDFLALTRMEHQGEGMWSNVMELLPGHNLTYSLQNHQYQIEKFYELKLPEEYFPPAYYSEEKILHELREKIYQSVTSRMQSDVSVGSCLSGGLDSSLIVGIMRDFLGESMAKEIPVFTASFPGSEIDETKWANIVSKNKNCKPHYAQPTANQLQEDLNDLIYCQDSPLWSTSTYAQYSVMRSVHQEGIKVVLDGQGGDELFAGYKPYLVYFWKELFKHAHFKSLFNELSSSTGLSGNIMYLTKEELKKRMQSGAGALMQKFYRNDSAYLKNDFKKSLTPSSREKFRDLNENLIFDFAGGRLKTYLKCEDRCAMRFSVESRTPFADDHELIEYVFKLPGEIKIKNGQLKYLLREAGKQYLPAEIYQRSDKVGYQTPNDFWLRQIHSSAFMNLNEKVFDYIDKARFEKSLNHLQKETDQLKKFQSGEETVILFKTLTLSSFFEVFNR